MSLTHPGSMAGPTSGPAWSPSTSPASESSPERPVYSVSIRYRFIRPWRVRACPLTAGMPRPLPNLQPEGPASFDAGEIEQ